MVQSLFSAHTTHNAIEQVKGYSTGHEAAYAVGHEVAEFAKLVAA